VTRDFSTIRSVLATDCGSTTTKAILIERREDGYRLIVRGEAPTTVEAPFEDVTRGVLNAATEVQELAGRKILDGERIVTPQEGDVGVDVYISTSSAGGGLQMMVAGVVKTMSAESAARAALGAGAIVMDTLAMNDGRLPHEKIERIRHLRPDMILLAGGVDGGTVSHVLELAELLRAANPRPRLGIGFALPVIYAGNKDAQADVRRILETQVALQVVENIRPTLEEENLRPARERIHDLFMEHVMAQAPGYGKLMSWADAPIMPTPGAVGSIIQTISQKTGWSVVGVDIGGATTDVFSVFQGTFNRTVSANLGMSYSVSNVLAEAGLPNILRWVPFEIDEEDLRNRIGNKMIRPTTIPQTLEELQIEQAISREALRLAFLQHKEFAVELRGVQTERTISDAFRQTASGKTLVDMMALGLLVGSGGVLSHAPRRAQSAMMMIDAFEPEGVTRLAVDSIFMMPQLGVLASLNEKAAMDVFDRDCLIRLGTCIAPVARGRAADECVSVHVQAPSGPIEAKIARGELRLVPFEYCGAVRASIRPGKGWDVGAGPGVPVETEIDGGVVGDVLDGRGRPLEVPLDRAKRVAALAAWGKALGVYPETA
jgi:uncharacterized protein (TIGR01319 family)